MNTSEEDFAKLGLSSDDWKAFILGRGTLAAEKLIAARIAVARLGRYTHQQATDIELLDSALRLVGTQYLHLWMQGGTLTFEEKIRYLQARDGCSREEAERHLEQVSKDNEEVARIFGNPA